MKLIRCSLIAAITLSAMSLFAEPWTFPAAKGVQFKNIPDWGKEGFTLEVWCKADKLPSGYAVLMRGSFGYPNFFGAKDIDCYLMTEKSKKNTAGRVYTQLEPGKYNYYVLTGDKNQSIAYRNGKVMRVNKGYAIPKYNAKNVLNIGHSIGWGKNFTGAVGMVRIHNRALSKAEIQANYTALQNNKALPEAKSLIFNQDRRELAAAAATAAAPTAAAGDELVLSGAEKAAAPDNAWVFPRKKAVSVKVPDWGRKGFTLEVYCMPEATDCGYAVLMRKSFGFPKFPGKKDFDCYVVNQSGKNAGGRVYMPLEINKYHYYAFTADGKKLVIYRDGKAVRTNNENGIPQYIADAPLHIGNSIGWAKNFKGKIALVRISNRALSAAEIKANNTALQNNQVLKQDDSVILNEDRRVTGYFYKFTAESFAFKDYKFHTLGKKIPVAI